MDLNISFRSVVYLTLPLHFFSLCRAIGVKCYYEKMFNLRRICFESEHFELTVRKEILNPPCFEIGQIFSERKAMRSL